MNAKSYESTPHRSAVIPMHLAATYPRVHARLSREAIHGASLLYEWTGQDRTRAPMVLMAHLDVVPVAAGSENNWTQPPYSGAIADGFVYGRGALDDKSATIAILEAVEQLLQEGFTPKRTVYLSFGGDEEVGGARGTGDIVRVLQARKVTAPFIVLDEGGALMLGELPGVGGPVAAIGIAEKGYLSLELSVAGTGGHSSTPVIPTQIGRLSTAIAKLEAHQFPERLEAPTLEMLRALAPQQPFGQQLLGSNPSPVSSVSGPAFAALTRAVQQTLGETPPLILPYLSGPTDSRYWCEAKAPDVFRFTPFLYEKDWSARVHGTDERISVQALADGVRFYRQLIRNVDVL